jgi:hypothetical protein
MMPGVAEQAEARAGLPPEAVGLSIMGVPRPGQAAGGASGAPAGPGS